MFGSGGLGLTARLLINKLIHGVTSTLLAPKPLDFSSDMVIFSESGRYSPMTTTIYDSTTSVSSYHFLHNPPVAALEGIGDLPFVD